MSIFCSPEMSRAPGAVLSVVCSSCLQAFHLQSGPLTHRNNDDPVLSLSLSYSQFSSVLIIVPQLQELPRYQDRGEREREGERKREGGRRRGGGEETRRDKKTERGRKESLHERKERELISKEEGEKG